VKGKVGKWDERVMGKRKKGENEGENERIMGKQKGRGE
jgi:hypothetical protein